jgi:hypothetical protein
MRYYIFIGLFLIAGMAISIKYPTIYIPNDKVKFVPVEQAVVKVSDTLTAPTLPEGFVFLTSDTSIIISQGRTRMLISTHYEKVKDK